MTPGSAKSKYLRPLNKYRHAKSAQDYFDQRVILKEDCWDFSTKGDKDGYHQVQAAPHCKQLKVTRAHQLSYVLYKGPITPGLMVCHSCDNPWCVNPDHLWLGTNTDNMRDMHSKNRWSPGKPSTLKVTPEIREYIKTQKGIKSSLELEKELNISFSRICTVWRTGH